MNRDSLSKNSLSMFIDAGHYNALQKVFQTNFDFLHFVDEVQKSLAERVGPLELSHIFYYDCLPHPDEVDAIPKRRAYFNFLKAQPGVQIREGTLVKRGDTYQQKGVDLLLGLDVAEECNKRLMTHLVLVTGDADLVPAIKYASHKGVQVWLFHGPRYTYADTLWSAADGRVEIDEDFVRRISRLSNHTGNTID